MNQSEKHKFEEEWEQMFESASETPPPTVWDAIDKRLDGEDMPAVIPLVWWKSPKLAYAAVAAAVALLLVSWPVLQFTKEGSDHTPQVALQSMTADSAVEVVKSDDFEEAIKANESLAASELETRIGQKKGNLPHKDQALQKASGSERQMLSAAAGKAKEPRIDGGEAALITGKNGLMPTGPTGIALKGPVSPAGDLPEQTDRNGLPSAGVPSADGPTPTLSESIALLSPVRVSEVDVYMRKRYVFYKPEFSEIDINPPAQQHREYWAGVGIMPAAFNPGVSVTSPPAVFSMAKASRQSLSNSSKAGLSYALQMQTGMKLSKHWTLETGLNYLQGNSTFESDGYVLDASTNRSANVLEGALLAGSSANKVSDLSPGLSQNMNTAAVYIDLDQRTSNDYRFVQVPVQAGYVLNPDGKVNYTILGGTVANVFLRNEVGSGSGSSFVNTADDGLYRSLSWSAATGVRFNYHLSDHWSANLTGSYQKALSSGLRSSSNLESRPQLYGVAWGVRYVF
jgi:hypothetical protein